METVKKGVQYFFDGTPFKVIYLILTFLSYTSFTAQTSFVSGFSIAVTALGGIVLLYRVCVLKRFIRTPNLIFLILFLLSFIITSLINWQYGIMGSLKGFVWMAFQYTLLYACDDMKETKFYKKEFHIIAIIFLAYLAICGIVSLYYLITGQGGVLEEGHTQRIFYGLWWQRLWGAFSEPNYAATSMSIGILLAFYFFKVCRQIWVKIGCWFLIALYASYILFSDSRTGKVCLMVGAAVITYLLIINPNKRNWKKASTQLIAIGLAACVGIGSFLGIGYTKKGYNYIQESISTSQENPEKPEETQKPNLEIGREQDLENDVSNGRFALWGSGIELFLTAPIFGVGSRNFIAAADDKIPNTYLVNNHHGKFNSTHNMFFDMLAAQGIVGTVLMLAAMVLIIICIIRLLGKNLKEDYTYIAILFAVVICAGVSGFFLPNIIYVNTQSSFIFWCFLGYLMHYYGKKRERKGFLWKKTKHTKDKNSLLESNEAIE